MTPYTVQYVGRHISHENVYRLNTEFWPASVIGKIQVGPSPGCSAQVIAPAVSAPEAAG